MGKKKKKKKKQAPPGVVRCTWRLMCQIIRFQFQPRFLVPVALLATFWILQPRIRRVATSLQSRPEYQIHPVDIRVTDPPRWVPANIVEQVVHEHEHLHGSMSLLDNALAKRVTLAFSEHAWIERVERLRRAPDGQVFVDVVWRRPVAMIQVKQGFYPVDVNGVLLPPADFSLGDTQQYPRITNVHSVPRGKAGRQWGDPVVVGASRIACLLQEHNEDGQTLWAELELSEIRAPRRVRASETQDDLVYELKARDGTIIVWGRPPGTDHPGELSPEQKLGRIKSYVRDYGGFAGHGGPFEIDIRHWHEISRRSLAARQQSGRG